MIYLVIIAIILTVLIRIAYVFYIINTEKVTTLKGSNVKTLVIMGSGGHTSEMVKLVSAMNLAVYSPRIFVIAMTDAISLLKVQKLEAGKMTPVQDVTIEMVVRSREVGQSWRSSFFSTFRALVTSLFIVWRHRPDLIVANGPGTCVPICYAAVLLQLFGIRAVRIAFVESICRVTSLSLSGYLLYPVADDFFVQWPQQAIKYRKAKYFGRMS